MTRPKYSEGYKTLLKLLEDPTLSAEQKTKLGLELAQIEIEKEKRSVQLLRHRGKKIAHTAKALKDSPDRFRP